MDDPQRLVWWPLLRWPAAAELAGLASCLECRSTVRAECDGSLIDPPLPDRSVAGSAVYGGFDFNHHNTGDHRCPAFPGF